MSATCPKCGQPYGLFDRLAKPIMCAKCDAKFGARSPLGSFDDDLATLPPGALADLDDEELPRCQLRIAKRNILVGAILIFLGVTSVAFLVMAVMRSGDGSPVPVTVIFFLGGFERLVRGLYQYHAVKHPKQSSPDITPPATHP